MGVLMALLLTSVGCSRVKVPAGNVGVKVYLLGGEKGVNQEVVGVGRYWLGWNTDMFIFPTFQQNYVWTKNPKEGSENDESITFQTKEGLEVSADVGISYHINPDKVSSIFQKYRKGVQEITDIYLRNYVRDIINAEASTMSVEETYGPGKKKLFDKVKKQMQDQVGPEGIIVDNIYLIGSFRLPDGVLKALNSKIEATQKAQQRENEVAEAKAQAEKQIAEARGVAESNRLKQQSITDILIRYEVAQKWDGKLPVTMLGNATPFINVNSK